MIIKMEYEIDGKNMCVIIYGEIDHYKVSEISGKIDKCIDQHHIKNLIFDFSNVDFCDSSGIGIVMGRYKKMAYLGGQVSVVGVGAPVDRIFSLTGLYKIVTKHENLESAKIV